MAAGVRGASGVDKRQKHAATRWPSLSREGKSRGRSRGAPQSSRWKRGRLMASGAPEGSRDLGRAGRTSAETAGRGVDRAQETFRGGSPGCSRIAHRSSTLGSAPHRGVTRNRGCEEGSHRGSHRRMFSCELGVGPSARERQTAWAHRRNRA
jgi:hypothetical protein